MPGDAERGEIDTVGDRANEVPVRVVHRDRVAIHHVLREHEARLRRHDRLRRDRARDRVDQAQHPSGRDRRRCRCGRGGCGSVVVVVIGGRRAATAADFVWLPELRVARYAPRRRHQCHDERGRAERQLPSPSRSPTRGAIVCHAACPVQASERYSPAYVGLPAARFLDCTPMNPIIGSAMPWIVGACALRRRVGARRRRSVEPRTSRVPSRS